MGKYKQPRKCEFCDYTTNHSSDYSRHKSKCQNRPQFINEPDPVLSPKEQTRNLTPNNHSSGYHRRDFVDVNLSDMIERQFQHLESRLDKQLQLMETKILLQLEILKTRSENQNRHKHKSKTVK